MKKSIIYLSLLFNALFLLSCGSKKGEIISESPDKSVKVVITGIKESFADPFKSTLTIRYGNGSIEHLQTDFYVSDLNEETIKFQWETNTSCRIIVKQQDDTKRIFVLDATNDPLNFQEINS